MREIVAVVFDLGNVLLPFDWNIAADRFCARCGCERRRLDDYIVTTPFVRQLSLGRITKEDFYRRLVSDFGYAGSFEEFALTWSDIFTRDEEMIGLAAAMKGRLPRYILSNTNAIHIEFLFSRFPFMHDFDGYVLSHEVGMEKPDLEIYRHTLEKFRLPAGGTVFIDDILANIEAARAVGMEGIHHRDAAATRRELTNRGVAPI